MRHSKFKWIKGTTNTYKTNHKNTDKRLKKKKNGMIQIVKIESKGNFWRNLGMSSNF